MTRGMSRKVIAYIYIYIYIYIIIIIIIISNNSSLSTELLDKTNVVCIFKCLLRDCLLRK